MKKLLDQMFWSDNKVYIQLYHYDKETDTYKYYKFDITRVDEGGHVGSEEYTVIEGKLNSCVEVDSDYIIEEGQKFGKFIPKLTKKKITFIN